MSKPNKGFILGISSTYWYPVTVDLLGEDGKTQKFEFDAKFKRLTDQEQQDIFNPPEGGKVISDNEVCDRVFVGWRNVYYGTGDEFPVDDANRELLLSIVPTRARVVAAWMKSIGLEGKVKNS